MKIIEQSYEILTDLSNPIQLLKNIEIAGRTCYKSEDKITDDSCRQFCQMLIHNGHTAMFEHSSISVRFITNRAIANEIVRHRHCAFAQVSTRYCNFSKGKFGNEIQVIKPCELEENSEQFERWYNSCQHAEDSYMYLVNNGVRAENARDVLPLCLATELVVTASIREWRSIFILRTTNFAHPQVRELMRSLLKEFQEKVPILFDDIVYE
jgi:thymidylate synthase (FAD)